MKNLKLLILSVAAAFMPALRSRYSTANSGAADLTDLQAQFTALQTQVTTLTAQNADLAKQVAAAKTAGANTLPPLSSTIALLAKGANVPVEDVRWRVDAGLTPQQAVQAAQQQVARDKAAAAAKAKKS